MSWTFRSWVAIFHLRPLMTFLSERYDMLVSLFYIFLQRWNFPISFSGRTACMSWNTWNRIQRSSTVDMGILSNNMKSSSPEFYMTFWSMTVCSDILHWSDITLIYGLDTDFDLVTEVDLLPNSERFSWNICKGCDMPREDANYSGHLVCLTWDLYMFRRREQSLWDFEFRKSLSTSILPLKWLDSRQHRSVVDIAQRWIQFRSKYYREGLSFEKFKQTEWTFKLYTRYILNQMDVGRNVQSVQDKLQY